MTSLVFRQFICRSDNYGLLLHDDKSGETVAIDAPDADKIARQLDAAGWKLTHIFTTHHRRTHKVKTDCIHSHFIKHNPWVSKIIFTFTHFLSIFS